LEGERSEKHVRKSGNRYERPGWEENPCRKRSKGYRLFITGNLGRGEQNKVKKDDSVRNLRARRGARTGPGARKMPQNEGQRGRP